MSPEKSKKNPAAGTGASSEITSEEKSAESTDTTDEQPEIPTSNSLSSSTDQANGRGANGEAKVSLRRPSDGLRDETDGHGVAARGSLAAALASRGACGNAAPGNIDSRRKEHSVGLNDMFLYAAKKSSMSAVELLLDKGANVNAVDNQGWTALHWAAASNLHELGRLLLSRGANANVVTEGGRTPRDLAVHYRAARVIPLLPDAPTPAYTITPSSSPASSRSSDILSVGGISSQPRRYSYQGQGANPQPSVTFSRRGSHSSLPPTGRRSAASDPSSAHFRQVSPPVDALFRRRTHSPSHTTSPSPYQIPRPPISQSQHEEHDSAYHVSPAPPVRMEQSNDYPSDLHTGYGSFSLPPFSNQQTGRFSPPRGTHSLNAPVSMRSTHGLREFSDRVPSARHHSPYSHENRHTQQCHPRPYAPTSPEQRNEPGFPWTRSHQPSHPYRQESRSSQDGHFSLPPPPPGLSRDRWDSEPQHPPPPHLHHLTSRPLEQPRSLPNFPYPGLQSPAGSHGDLHHHTSHGRGSRHRSAGSDREHERGGSLHPPTCMCGQCLRRMIRGGSVDRDDARGFSDASETRSRRLPPAQNSPPRMPSRPTGPGAESLNSEREESPVLHNLRRCADCGTMSTPQWRRGPLGPATLCNSCGLKLEHAKNRPRKNLRRRELYSKQKVERLEKERAEREKRVQEKQIDLDELIAMGLLDDRRKSDGDDRGKGNESDGGGQNSDQSG